MHICYNQISRFLNGNELKRKNSVEFVLIDKLLRILGIFVAIGR